jgi:hypothetical protein
LVDEKQDWIEKYRAALDQQPLRGTARLSAAFQGIAKGFAFALGRTFGKPENNAVTRRSPEREMKGQPSPDMQTNQRSSREESPRLTPQDKKAS